MNDNNFTNNVESNVDDVEEPEIFIITASISEVAVPPYKIKNSKEEKDCGKTSFKSGR